MQAFDIHHFWDLDRDDAVIVPRPRLEMTFILLRSPVVEMAGALDLCVLVVRYLNFAIDDIGPQLTWSFGTRTARCVGSEDHVLLRFGWQTWPASYEGDGAVARVRLVPTLLVLVR